VTKPSIIALPFAQHIENAALQVLDPAAQQKILGVSQLVVLAPHIKLYAQGDKADYVYNIVDGTVETYYSFSDGRRTVSAFLFPLDLVGLSENGHYLATAETLMEVKAFKIPLNILSDILQEDARLSVGFLLKLCHDLRDSERHAINISHHAAHVRIASFLVWLTDAMRLRDERGRTVKDPIVSLALPMTRTDIADYLGLTVESVSRGLHFLEAEKVIQRRGPRDIDILDREKLAALSKT